MCTQPPHAFPRCHLRDVGALRSTAVQRYYMKNSRIKESFRLSSACHFERHGGTLSRSHPGRESALWPGPPSATSVIRLTVKVTQCLCSVGPYCTALCPQAESSLNVLTGTRHVQDETRRGSGVALSRRQASSGGPGMRAPRSGGPLWSLHM